MTSRSSRRVKVGPAQRGMPLAPQGRDRMGHTNAITPGCGRFCEYGLMRLFENSANQYPVEQVTCFYQRAVGTLMGDERWLQSQGVNVYQMSMAHGGPGFWVQRTTWGGTCVRVGPIIGPPPYYGNPSVLMDVYTLDGRLKKSAAPLPAAGTYKTWRQIDPPHWASGEELRPLDDPQLDWALSQFENKRHTGDTRGSMRDTPTVTDQTFLAVPYPRKDEAKRLGARWSPEDRKWWLPANDAQALARARALGFLD